MSDEPKANMNLDPEMLAAYIDNRLTPEQRAEVEAQLARDPDSYAVLVESIKALDELKVPEVTKVPDAPKSRRWTIVAGVLAAAAAIVLVVRLQPDLLQRIRGERVDPRFEQLIAAIGEQRYVEPRLSGGFKFGPVRAATRGAADSPKANLSLVAAAGEIQKTQRSTPSSSNLHALGVAQLQLQDYDEAVRSLEVVVANEPENASALNDLAGAYGTRAQRANRPEDWPRAIDAISRALALNPESNESLFNKAWILEGSLLTNQAIEAWRSYLEHDGTSPWAEEARQRLANLEKLQSRFDRAISAVQIATTSLTDGMSAAEIAALDPALVTVWIQTVVIQRWASAPDKNSAELALRRGSAVNEIVKDRWVRDALSCLRSPADAATQKSLATFAEGMKHSVLDAASVATPLFEHVMRSMQTTCEPVALAAAFHATTLDSQRGSFHKMLPEVEAVRQRAASEGYSAIEGLSSWRIALAYVRQGQFELGIRNYRNALRAFGASGQRQNAANMNSLLAETYRALGDMRSAWRYHRTSMELGRSVSDLRIHHQLFSQHSLSSLKEGLSRAALEYQDAMIDTDRAWGNTGALAMAYVQRARSFVRLRQDDAALRDSDEALQLVEAIPDAALRLRVRAEALASRAEALGPDRRDQAAADYLASSVAFAQSGTLARAATITLQRGDVLWSAGRKDAAVDDWENGLRYLQRSRRSLTDASLRLTQATSMRPILERLASAALDRGDEPAVVLDLAERALFQTTAEILNSEAQATDITEIRSALSPHVALVYYLSLNGRFLGAVVRNSGVSLHDLSLPSPPELRTLLDKGANYDALIRPLRPVLAGIDTLIVVPDRATSQVSWAGLLDNGDGSRLIENFRLAMVPSGTVYSLLVGRASSKPLLRVSAFGYGAAPENEDLPVLALAEQEASRVAARYKYGQAWVGASASIENFEAALKTDDVVHFAGHGVYNPDDPMTSRLLLAPDESGRSQLMVDDLTRLRGVTARVVVLAACRTAGAGSGADEAALGLTRPLLASGVSSVIATVRDVDDAATAKLMTALHGQLSRGLSPGSALQQAQIEMRRQDSLSSNWAAFALYGLP